jgi:hypothetical protein
MTDAEDKDNYPTQPLPRYEEAQSRNEPGEEEIVTPVPHVHVPAGANAAAVLPPGPRRSALLGVLTGIALALSLASLLLSLTIMASLSDAQRAALEGIDSAISALDNLEGEGFSYEYRFERTIPVSSSIPIHEEMVIPFSGDFPINTVVQVPINAGILGRFMVDVPINTSVQVDTEVPINIDQTFEISTSIPVSMVIPIEVRPDDPAVQEGLSGLRSWLVDLRRSLSGRLRLPFLGDLSR